jgi:IS30 family transposase
LYKEGFSISEIAVRLNRNKSSVSREIYRNKNKDGSYHPWRATSLYLCRRKNSVRRSRFEDEDLRAFVADKLNIFWTPECIAERWKVAHCDQKLSCTTIYTGIRTGQLGVSITPKTHLRRKNKRRISYNCATIKPMHRIEERPEVINSRSRLGDLEGDTVLGPNGKGGILTLVDRKSRMLYAGLIKNKESEQIKQKLLKLISGKRIHSITLDNGSEFAKFQEIENKSGAQIYFAAPRSPWQRGTNENINGQLRFFFPKGTDFLKVTDKELTQAVTLLNNRPRKCLGWLSPLEFISSKCCT